VLHERIRRVCHTSGDPRSGARRSCLLRLRGSLSYALFGGRVARAPLLVGRAAWQLISGLFHGVCHGPSEVRHHHFIGRCVLWVTACGRAAPTQKAGRRKWWRDVCGRSLGSGRLDRQWWRQWQRRRVGEWCRWRSRWGVERQRRRNLDWWSNREWRASSTAAPKQVVVPWQWGGDGSGGATTNGGATRQRRRNFDWLVKQEGR